MLQYDFMNISDCAMSKENTPIFSCVPAYRNISVSSEASSTSKSPFLTPTFLWDNETSMEDEEFFRQDDFMKKDRNDDTDKIMMMKHNEVCKDHRERSFTGKNIFGSWRCPDIIEHSRDALNDYCVRPSKMIILYCINREFNTHSDSWSLEKSGISCFVLNSSEYIKF